MTAINDVTGDLLKSKKATDSYRDGWDRIFGKKTETPQVLPVPQLPPALPAPHHESGLCEKCGKWKGAHAILPGQPTDSLCFCPRFVNGQWEGRPVTDLMADRPDAFAELQQAIKDGKGIWC